MKPYPHEEFGVEVRIFVVCLFVCLFVYTTRRRCCHHCSQSLPPSFPNFHSIIYLWIYMSVYANLPSVVGPKTPSLICTTSNNGRGNVKSHMKRSSYYDNESLLVTVKKEWIITNIVVTSGKPITMLLLKKISVSYTPNGPIRPRTMVGNNEANMNPARNQSFSSNGNKYGSF
jgi:hypothetical protein